MELFNIIKENIFLIILIILILGGIIVVGRFIRKVDKTVRSGMRQIDTVRRTIDDVQNIARVVSTVAEAAEDMDPTPKSVGGATNMHLKNILSDFPGFHNQDAEAAIRTFVEEYLNIKYGNQKKFVNSKVNENLLFNINKVPGQKLSNLKFNGMAIYNYDKSQDYATITYKCSFGYNLGSVRQEVRYDIDYTLQLFENNIAQKAMKCSNCGGPLSTRDNVECPYCGTKIIMDTIMSWYITEMTQN